LVTRVALQDDCRVPDRFTVLAGSTE
jgi:hypothetical protein